MVRRYLLAGVVLVALGGSGALARLYVDGMLPAGVPESAPPLDDAKLAEALGAVDLSGAVDFEGLKKNRAPLDAFVAALAKTSPDTAPEKFKDPADQLAFWLNAYDALALQALVDRWPEVGSPDALWLGRFYWGLSWPVGGKRLTLRAIEKRLSDGLGDPRALLALACGAKSCASLDTTPFMGATVDGQLNDAVRRFMADEANTRLDGKTVHLSPLLQRHQAELVAALPEGRRSVLQFVWAFLPDACRVPESHCLVRADLDKACGPKLDGCTLAFEKWDGAVRVRR